MDNTENTENVEKNTQENYLSASDFFKKFLLYFILGTIVSYTIAGLVENIISLFFTGFATIIINFIITTIGFFITGHIGIKSTLKIGKLKEEDIKKVTKKINILLILVCLLNILYYGVSAFLIMFLLVIFRPGIVPVILLLTLPFIFQFIFVMMFYKNTLEHLAAGKKSSKIPYLFFIIFIVLIITWIMHISKIGGNEFSTYLLMPKDGLGIIPNDMMTN